MQLEGLLPLFFIFARMGLRFISIRVGTQR